MNTLHELVWWRNRLTVILSLMEAEQTCAPNGIRWTHSVPFCWRAAKICGYDCVYLLDTVPSSDSQSVSLTIYWVWIFFCTVISNWMFYCQSLHYDLNNVLLIHRNIFAKLFLKQHSDGLEHEKNVHKYEQGFITWNQTAKLLTKLASLYPVSWSQLE